MVEAVLWSAGILAGIFVFWRMPALPRAGTGGGDISVVIPARNEADNLPQLLASLAAQYPRPREVIVVDDHSTDGTARIAAAAGARVIPARPLPQGWTGKAWACRQGADAARGDRLLFLDADTRLEPGGLARLAAALDSGFGAVSAAPYHLPQRPYEELSSFFNVVVAAGMRAFRLCGKRQPAGMFGPCLLITRKAYNAGGTHAAVRGEILEHYFFTRHLQEAGVAIGLYAGRGAVSVRMYPDGLVNLTNGWSKAYATGAGNTPPAVLFPIILWLAAGLGAPLSFVLRLGGAFPGTPLPFAIITAVYALVACRMFRMVGRFSFLTALVYPLPLLFHFAVFVRSFFYKKTGRTVTWKSRQVEKGEH